MKTIILGGYGNFGARICRALANSPGMEVIVAGRDVQRAKALAAELGNGASGLRVDLLKEGLAAVLRSLKAELVIHTAGPFQQQGYEVPLAVAAAGAHYIDLADGRRFVCDFPKALDAAFVEAGRIAISGASTVPALSSAVVNDLTKGWSSIDEIDICIAPAQTAPRGKATMAAVLNYCGAPIQVWENGAWVARYGWADPEQVEFKRLRPRLGALCDIPDLELFPEAYPGVSSVMFRAALEVSIAQRALSMMAAMRRMRLINKPDRFAGLLNSSARSFDRLGSALGGMVVRVSGKNDAGNPVRRAWHIAADNDHGPEIPCMAAILLARNIAMGKIRETGACTSMGLLRLADFAPEFAKWNMITDVIEENAQRGTQTV